MKVVLDLDNEPKNESVVDWSGEHRKRKQAEEDKESGRKKPKLNNWDVSDWRTFLKSFDADTPNEDRYQTILILLEGMKTEFDDVCTAHRMEKKLDSALLLTAKLRVVSELKALFASSCHLSDETADLLNTKLSEFSVKNSANSLVGI